MSEGGLEHKAVAPELDVRAAAGLVVNLAVDTASARRQVEGLRPDHPPSDPLRQEASLVQQLTETRLGTALDVLQALRVPPPEGRATWGEVMRKGLADAGHDPDALSGFLNEI
jgi:hypothetical protein